MRLQVQIANECLALPCQESQTVHDFAHLALDKLVKLRPENISKTDVPCEILEVRKTVGGSLLDPDDLLGEVLRDGEFVLIVLKSDLPTGTVSHPIISRPPAASLHTLPDALFYSYDHPESFKEPEAVLYLDGSSLTSGDLLKCGRGEYKLEISLAAEQKIKASEKLLKQIVKENRVVYGVTTGFGSFANVCVHKDQMRDLQVNLIRSHACGVGQCLPPSRARMLMALRINVLAKGYSGICLQNVRKLVQAFNAFCVSWIPEKGTVGCSGDLTPLAHLALGMLGEGRMWSPKTGWDDAGVVLSSHGIEPLKLGPKEGLALINGTQMVTALGAEAVERADAIARQADIIAALTLDVLKGTTKAYDAAIHQLRPHTGQIKVATKLRALLHSETNPSQIAESHRFCGQVQDCYTLRCVPQVHGVVHDTIAFCKGILNTELNSATDNPLVFGDRGEILSGGNFHGEYPAKILDYLAIAVHELGQMSERRLERLVNSNYSGLPTYLTPRGGLNSGFMMVQVVAAALVSENKVLCHPSSVDSIPTSCNQEDHVSMGGFAARKALTIVEHVEQIMALELLAACQGMEFLKPLKSTAPLQRIYQLVRTFSDPIDKDRYMVPDIDKVTDLLRIEKIWHCVKPHLETTENLEKLDPELLRIDTGSPTGIMHHE